MGWGERDIPGIYALCVVSLLIGFNLLTIFFFLCSILNSGNVEINRNWGYILFLFSLSFNYLIIYKYPGIQKIVIEYDTLESQKVRNLKYWAISYTAISILLFFGSIFL